MLNVMIADDSRIVRELVSKIVIELGHRVIFQAFDGIDATDKYKSQKPDLVFMDITMPRLNGLDALRKIKKLDNNAKVVMLTSKGEQFVVKESIKLGACGYILKPVSVEKIEDSIKRVFDTSNILDI
jgi:two-component system chemotaxis response regulator CheY